MILFTSLPDGVGLCRVPFLIPYCFPLRWRSSLTSAFVFSLNVTFLILNYSTRRRRALSLLFAKNEVKLAVCIFAISVEKL